MRAIGMTLVLFVLMVAAAMAGMAVGALSLLAERWWP